ncbi:MAG: hypothetical protein NC320_09080 [Clostridium sp.]|nr:hypothetical protein [Clostridium sp.]MCM1547920.1 hypothetical protein [Ruminococcus sp.]
MKVSVKPLTKAAALHQFFSGFGIPAYVTSNVPDNAVFPYLTYEFITSSFDEGEAGLTVNLWYYTDSEKIPNAKAQEISDRIGRGGVTIPCGGGMIWLKRGSPFCQGLKDDTDAAIKRRYMNITAEYITAD